MSHLLPHLQAATEINATTLTLILVMCSFAMFVVKNQLVVPSLVVVLYPMIVTLSVLANYALTRLEMFQLSRYDQWLICTISSATIGTVMGLGFGTLLARTLDMIATSRARKRRA